MPDRIDAQVWKETPIERIFEKVMRRKMTPKERAAFHLKEGQSLDPRGNGHTSRPNNAGAADGTKAEN